MSQVGTITVGAKLAGGTQQAFKAIADGMRTMAKAMSTLAKDTQKLASSTQSQAYGKMAKEMGNVANRLDALVGGTVEATVQTKALAAAQEDASKSTSKLEQEIEEQVEAVLKLNTGMKKHEVQAEVLRIRYAELIKSQTKVGVTAKAWINQLQKGNADMAIAREKVARYNKQFVEASQVQTTYFGKLSALEQKYQKLFTSQDRFGKSAADLRKKFQGQVKDLSKYEQALNKLQKEQTESVKALNQSKVAADSLSHRYDKLINSSFKYAKNAQLVIANLRKTDISIKDARNALFQFNKEWLKTKAGQEAAAKLAISMERLRNKYAAVITDQDRFAARSALLFRAFERGSITFEQLGIRLQKLNTQFKASSQAAAKAKQEMVKARYAASKLSMKYQELLGSTSKYANTAKRTIQLLREQRISADRASIAIEKLNQRQLASIGPVTQAWKRLGRSFKTYMSYVAASSTIFAFIGAARSATQTVIDFDQALKDLQAITRATDEEVAQMGEKIKQVASDTKFSATEIADGMKLLGQSGLSAKESIETIDAVSTLATGTLTDLATTVDLVTTSMRVFGIESHNTSLIADVFANAVNRSKLTIDKIRTAMNYIGPVAAAAGASIEQTASAMMILANQGIRASTIGTGLRQVFRRLVDPSSQMEQSMAAANITMDDFNIKALGLSKVVDNLRLVIRRTGDETEAAFEMFGQRGATAALALIKGQADAVGEMMAIVQRSGAAAEMAAIQMEGLGVSFKNLQDKIKNLYIAMGESGLHGALRAIVDTSRVFVDMLTGVFSNSITQFITKWTILIGVVSGFIALIKWIAGASFVVGVFNRMALSVALYTAAMSEATTATAAFGTTITYVRGILMTLLPAAVITGLLVLVSYMWRAQERVEEFYRSLQKGRLEQQDHINALQGGIAVLEAETATYEEKQDILDDLIATYPHLSEKIDANRDSVEGLIPVLEDELEVHKKILDALYKKELLERGKKLEAKQTSIETTTKMRDRFKDGTSIWLRMSEKIIKEREEYSKQLREYATMVAKQLNADDANIRTEVANIMAGRSQDSINAVIKLIERDRAKAEDAIKKYQKHTNKSREEAVSDLELTGDASQVKDDHKQKLAELDSYLEAHNLAVQRAVAERVLTEEEGLRGIQEMEISASKKRIEIAQKSAIALEYHGDTPGKVKMYAEKERLEEAHYKKLGQYLKKHNTEVLKQEEKLKENRRKGSEEEKQNTDKLKRLSEDRAKVRADNEKETNEKIQDFRRDLAQKIEDIELALSKKLKDLSDKRVEIERAAQAKILGIRESFEEKLLKLSQRGMSDSEKELSNESFAREQFAAAQTQFSKATRAGDLEGVQHAYELFEKAGDYFGDLADTSKARAGLTSVRDMLLAVAEAEGKINLEKNKQEQADAQRDASDKKSKAQREADDQLTDFKEKQAEKLQAALDTITKQEEAEGRRHQKVVDNLLRERGEIIKNGEEAARAQQNILNMMNQSEYAKDNVGTITRRDGNQKAPSQAGQVFPQEAEKATEKGVKKGATKGLVEAAKSPEFGNAIYDNVESAEAGQAIAEDLKTGVQEGIFDGVQVEGMPLEEWKALGREQGGAAGEEMGQSAVDEFTAVWLAGTSEGLDVAAKVMVDPNDSDEAWATVSKKFEDSPFEIGIDRAEFDRLMRNIVADAQRRYKVVIPVTTSQPRAEGGPVVKMASGGRLPGQSSPYDSVDVKARPGEWFIKNESVAAWSRAVGNWFMPGVNRPNSMAGQILQGMLARGAAASSQPEFPDMGSLTIKLGEKQAQVMGTPNNLKTFAGMLQDMEAYSS